MSTITTSSGIPRDPVEIVPFVGMAGLYTVKDPYTFSINVDTEYTCTSSASLVGLISNGRDPWEEIYKPAGGTEELYQEDLINNRCVVTIQSGNGEVFEVPNSSIIPIPIEDGIRYVSAILAVSLAAIPESLDVTVLSSDVSDLIMSRLGIQSQVYFSWVGAAVIVSHENHAGIEAARRANIGSHQNNLMRIVELQEANQKLLAKQELLEAWIKNRLLEEQTNP